MPSTSSSNLIAECENLNLSYRLRLHRPPALRDLFVKTLKDPMAALFTSRENLHVLRDINLKILKGDRIGLLGVNGAGKTSLCRCFAQIYRPKEGLVQVHGSVRAIFDTSVGIYPELTGRENAEILVHFLYPNDSHRYPEIIQDAIAFSELGGFIDAPFKTYSNGMQARLCLSLVSCVAPDLLILDEVFDGADRFFRHKIARRIVQMIQKSGAVIFVSHSPEQVQALCNRVVILNHSRIVFDGPTDEGVQFFNSMQPRLQHLSH